MSKRGSLQTKMLFQILIIVIAAFIFVGVFVGVSNRVVATKNAHSYTELQTQINAEKVNSFLENHYSYLQAFENALAGWNQLGIDSIDAQLEALMLNQIRNQTDYPELWAVWNTNESGKFSSLNAGWLQLQVTPNSNSVNVIKNISTSNTRFQNLLSSTTDFISSPYLKNDVYHVDIAVPFMQSGTNIGFVGASLSLKALQSIIDESTLPQGSFITILDNNGLFVLHNEGVFIGKTFEENFPAEAHEWPVHENVAKGLSFSISNEFGGDTYYSCFQPVYFGNNLKALSVEITIPMSKLLIEAKASVMRSVIAAFCAMIVMILIVWLILRRLVQPIKSVTSVLELLSNGDTESIKKVEINSKDELQEMGDSLNKVVDGIKSTEHFALEIGNGNFQNEYKLLSDADQLGKALIHMRENLKTSEEEQKRREEEEKQRNWANQGIAKFGEILRQNNNNLKALGYQVISNLVDYLKINQAAIFVLNDEASDEGKTFDCLTTYAFNREKSFKKTIAMGEGLVGQSAYEKQTIYITEVPNNYHEITSGLGTASPKCVLIVPCALDEEVYSVIEIASFTTLEKHEIEFVESLASSIASTIASVRINEKTSKLLSTSQNQSEELSAQEEELRQNLEEMETTQEDLQRQMKENAKMRENLSQQNALLDALLESLPDFIYFKDKDCKFIRISKSMLTLFNGKEEKDIIGLSDFDFHNAENAQQYFNDEQDIMQTRKGFVDKLQHETTASGEKIWNSVTKMPLIDADGNVFGTFGISKNVTELKELEIEAQNRKEETLLQEALLKALLQSIPDYIYFKDRNSRFIQLSDSMLKLFKAESTEEIIGKSDFDFQKSELAQEYYDDEQNIINKKKGIKDKLQQEFLKDGTEQWMSVTKLPLFNAEGNVMGTFGISKNVTEIKNLEMQAKAKNEELQAQEEELRQNLEEMQSVQEDLKSQMDINRKTRESLMEEKLLLDALMNSLPDYIYFKDAESKFLRISKSMVGLFGAKNVKEIIGKSDFDFQTEENAKKYFADEQKIIKSKKGITDQLQKEQTGSGEIIWNSVTKLPLLNDQGEAVGTFGISKDVTKIKLEAIKRENQILKTIQTFNKSIFTIEYDLEGNITDVNERLLKYFGIKEKDIIGKHHKDGLKLKDITNKQYQAFWSDILKGNIKKQLSQLSIKNKKVWLTETYNPIVDEDGKVIKVLKIAFDVDDLVKYKA